MTFKRRSGLYFWSCIAAAVGTSLMSLQLLLFSYILGERHLWLTCTLGALGFMMYLPGDYMMLYSRLHILGTNPRVLRWTLRAIVLETVCIELPCTILYSLSYWGLSPALSSAIANFEIVEAVFFLLCQAGIAALYMFQLNKTWRTGSQLSPAHNRTLKKVFLGMFFLILLLMTSPVLVLMNKPVILLAFFVRLHNNLEGRAALIP